MQAWRPSLGAWREDEATRFRVWAPGHPELSVVLEGFSPRAVTMERDAEGYHSAQVEGTGPGALYRYRLPHGDFPDPASRFQPDGVHGHSEVIDPSAFAWTDDSWKGCPLKDLTIYELHVGTFTAGGTYREAIGRLPYLKDLGVSAVELMPLADFPGRWNWGYDGAALFAPARCYGRPDDLRAFVDAAHGLGLAVLLDVVYNHLGPDGCYVPTFFPEVFSTTHESPWGRGLNFDGPGSHGVRDFFLQNALHWLTEYRFDGLRLDATFAIQDQSEKHFLKELSEKVAEVIPDRVVHLIAEDHRNLDQLVRTSPEGFGLHAQWADELHHVVRVALSGDNYDHFQDYEGTAEEMARVYEAGWLYSGQHSPFKGGPKGSDPRGLHPRSFVHCIQNHDQVGNRAHGERLNHDVEPAAYGMAVALLLFSPGTPMLFMGQEWAAATPFQYFTDHNEQLGQAVREGRKVEFEHLRLAAKRPGEGALPDPQDPETFHRSKLDWSEPGREPFASVLRLHKALLRLRSTEPALGDDRPGATRAAEWSESGIVVRRESDRGDILVMVAAWEPDSHALFRGDAGLLQGLDLERAEVVLTTQDQPFASAGQVPDVEMGASELSIRFGRPSAVILRLKPR